MTVRAPPYDGPPYRLPPYVHDALRPLGHAPAAMYFVVCELPSSITSGASFAASAASNFWSTVFQLWYWMSTSTPGCCFANAALAAATAAGQPFCASVMSQTVTLSAVARCVPPVAVEAAVASAAASTTAAMMRNFMWSPCLVADDPRPPSPVARADGARRPR